MGFRLTKDDRIRHSSEYREITHRGKGYRTAHFRIRILSNSRERTRLGIVVGRKTGSACARNRIKRQVREFFRLNRERLPHSADVVFIALKGASHLTTSELNEELGRFFDTEFAQ